MTIAETVKVLLQENGMWGKDVDDVFELAKNDDVLKSALEIRWNDDFEGYPPQFRSALWYSVKRIALKYIIENTPKAFYREFFED